jgi:TetR/AcrR family transcriptional repressor of nem operon
MARPRTFDPNTVLDVARDVFWRKGYQATSLDDLTAVTGLTKPSLYAAFGDKASLFLKVLDRYHDRSLRRTAVTVAGEPSMRVAIEAWLKSLPVDSLGPEGQRGWLSVNTATDGSLNNPALEQSILRFNARLEELIRARFEADRERFPNGFDPIGATHTVMTVYVGLMAMAKQAPSPEWVRSVIEQVGKMLD